MRQKKEKKAETKEAHALGEKKAAGYREGEGRAGVGGVCKQTFHLPAAHLGLAQTHKPLISSTFKTAYPWPEQAGSTAKHFLLTISKSGWHYREREFSPFFPLKTA